MEEKMERSPLWLLAGIMFFAYGGAKFWDLVIVPHAMIHLPEFQVGYTN